MRRLGFLSVLAAFAIAGSVGFANDEAAKKELAPSGTLRVGIAVAPSPGAGNVGKDEKGNLSGVAVDLGRALAKELGVPVAFVEYANSGALTDAADGNAWDVAFIPVDAERKKRVTFGPAHVVLQSTYLVPPGSKIQTLADVDRAGVRVVGVENTATARAAAATLKNTKIEHVKGGGELFEALRTGKADAIAQSRESLTALSAKLPGSRVLDGAYLSSFVAIAVPREKPNALAYVTTFIEAAKASGAVRRSLDGIGLKSSVVAAKGQMP